MIHLPPDDDSLDLHLKSTNYIVYCQRHYNIFEHPSPLGHGWQIINGKCRPVRHSLPPLPQQLTPLESMTDSSDRSSSDGEQSECGESAESDEE